MKLKEVCEATGLSRKTIRLYEEKGLLTPQKEHRNGRDYREYTEADVRQLEVIASLRRAWFTMEEIRRMQQDPAAIQEILPQYREWLLAQKCQLDGLLAATEQIEPENVASVEELSAKMAAETSKLPLPLMDRNPHFKHLDAMEEVARTMRKPSNEENKKRAFRQTALVMDRDKSNDQAITLGQIQEVGHLDWSNNGPVVREETEPKWVRVLSTIGGWVLAAGIVVLAAVQLWDLLTIGYSPKDTPTGFIIGAILLLAGAILYGSMRGLVAYRDRKRWLQVVRQQELEKQRQKQK